ncbi:aminoglycoside phosphotransferase family protein [Novosphingobium sp. G106]|uniref:aminoglycoside phosphotransferase family protein n=1 Tax=Novosphingobium sp. G106 TaxID=2849500 RepID=UPI001C2D8458|nr:aminoglycoside phosphotransferase family protein [Novosphingobium sp. G106]MBV1686145.1 aminoglycoside phosphotransferase family protein [Novosphingobium sp. G106]
MTVRTPRELIEIYWEQIYNAGEVELVREVCADPIIRHDPGFVTTLSHDEQIVRIHRSLAMKPLFTHRVLHADDTFVTSVWNMVSRDGRDITLCGIEVFEAQDGRFTRCWNSSYAKGFWGEDGDMFDLAALEPPLLIEAPAGITADWLQRAFAAGGAVAVQRLAMEPEITPIGHGTTSATVRVRAAYNDGHIIAPRSAICKIGKWPGGASAISPFERECQAYALFGDAPAFRVPRLYYGASDNSGLSNLLIEDLSGTARAGDQIAGCSVTEAGAVVRELARFHRGYCQRPDLFELAWLSRPRPLLPAYAKGAAELRDWLGDRIPAASFAVIDRFGALTERWLEHVPAYRTLIHGDPRVDNVLFEDKGESLRACLIDWQSLGSGDPQHDVAYFLSGSLSVEERRACERDLIAEHARLMAAADPHYTVERALESYRRHIVSGLWLTVIAAAFVERNAHNAQLLEVLVTRNTAAVQDWDGLAAIT